MFVRPVAALDGANLLPLHDAELQRQLAGDRDTFAWAPTAWAA